MDASTATAIGTTLASFVAALAGYLKIRQTATNVDASHQETTSKLEEIRSISDGQLDKVKADLATAIASLTAQTNLVNDLRLDLRAAQQLAAEQAQKIADLQVLTTNLAGKLTERRRTDVPLEASPAKG